ncbi:bifunctional diguanylate cyclase/phosphodiesterase [Marinobacter sp. SS21]|uniref:bifunctional diguanylate cyclase/phosphodiesterase n=1 Tax=Marinobacter sp. SS21 TaxID=2979460 RepID=UPI00232FE150|nr:EAL domain-containing protein [Marinobacter sp. SS21]MDC0663920.1 EAL domain-containing protein [Marinobacter sp. SS21]
MTGNSNITSGTDWRRIAVDLLLFGGLAYLSYCFLHRVLVYPSAWLPTGYAIGLLLTHGTRRLGTILSGILLASLIPAVLDEREWSGAAQSVASASAYTLATSFITWWAYRKLLPTQLPLDRYTSFLWFLGALTLASFAATLPMLTQLPQVDAALKVMPLHPWFASVLGTVIVAPVMMSNRWGSLYLCLRKQPWEALAWTLTLGFVLLVVWHDPLQNLYLMFLLTIWAGTRFPLPAAMASIALCGAGALSAIFLSMPSPVTPSQLLVMEALLALMVTVSCYVRILLNDRERIEIDLEDMVRQRTNELQIANAELKDEIFVRQQAEKSYRRSSRHFRALFETASTPIVVVDEKINIRQWNSASESLFGYSRDEAIGRSFSTAFIPSEQRDELSWKILKLFKSGLPQETLETEIQGFNGSQHFILWNLSRLNEDDDPGQRRLILIGQDITEIRNSQNQLHYLAHYDVLTNTANRRLFEDRCGQAISSALRHGHSSALICLDVDHFKRINDTLGHDAGDQLLKELAQRLRNCVRKEDTIARLGGDEFAVLLSQVKGAEGCEKVARYILDTLIQPIKVSGGELVITSSIGITLAPEDGSSYEQLLKNADMAMYRAKNAGRNNIQFFSKDMNDEMQRQLTLEQELRDGIRNGQLDLHYQPVLNAKTGAIDGLEALLRWHHPSKGTLTPAEFLDIAEQTGQLQPLAEWICLNACLQARAIQAMSKNPVCIRVNLSSRQYNHPKLADQLGRIIRETRLDPSLLLIEIDERILSERHAESVLVLDNLKRLGVGLVLDHYGSGLSSLKLLRDLPFDQVKIDQQLLHLAPKDDSSRAIVHTLINLARQLSLTVAASGVETEDQETFLRSTGCHLLQGHRFCRPVPSNKLAELFARVKKEGSLLTDTRANLPLTGIFPINKE